MQDKAFHNKSFTKLDMCKMFVEDLMKTMTRNDKGHEYTLPILIQTCSNFSSLLSHVISSRHHQLQAFDKALKNIEIVKSRGPGPGDGRLGQAEDSDSTVAVALALAVHLLQCYRAQMDADNIARGNIYAHTQINTQK